MQCNNSVLHQCKATCWSFYFSYTWKENHRMFGVGRDLCGSSSPTPLPKQGHTEQAAQDHVQVGLEYLQRTRLHNLPGQPVPVLHHPQREEVLPHMSLVTGWAGVMGHSHDSFHHGFQTSFKLHWRYSLPVPSHVKDIYLVKYSPFPVTCFRERGGKWSWESTPCGLVVNIAR